MFKIQTHYKVVAVFLFVLALSFVSGGKVQAASLTVNSTDDTALQDDGDCTLREAINNVNAGSDTTDGGGGGDCVAGDGFSDTITIPAGTFTLSSNLPAIDAPITIQGQGMGQTIIDGDGARVVFNQNSSSTDATIRRLTITAFRGTAITLRNNAQLSQIEIDGTGGAAQDGVFRGVSVDHGATGDYVFAAEDVYIHDFSVPATSSSNGMQFSADSGTSTNLSLRRITISRISNSEAGGALGIIVLAGITDNFTPATIDLNIDNVTVTELSAPENSAASGIAVAGAVASGETNINATINNVTINDIAGGVRGDFPMPSSGIGILGIAALESDVMKVDVDASNLLINNVHYIGEDANCGALDLTSVFGGTGTPDLNITSRGGNLSSDNTCSPYFTQPTDQNNLTNLASTLAPLSFNGGSVPTIPLLQGSPAIDSGVTVAGLTADARGAARPQGSAYDSGAYESPYTKPVTSLAVTGQNTALFMAIATSMLTLATGVIVLRRQHFN